MRPSLHQSAAAAATTLAAVLAPLASHAQPGGPNAPLPLPESPTAAIVEVPTPWYAPRALVVRRMRDTVPEYQAAPGLAFKAYSFARADGRFGGLYLWRDAASAQAWFGPGWFERVRKERGAEGQVRLFSVPVSLDNVPGGTPAADDSGAVATLVSVPIPAGVTVAQLVLGFKASVPQYQKVPGLLRKDYTIAPDGSFGGIYLWKDVASAERWFTEAWHQQVRQRYGAEARVEWFDTPILMPTQNAANRIASIAP